MLRKASGSRPLSDIKHFVVWQSYGGITDDRCHFIISQSITQNYLLAEYTVWPRARLGRYTGWRGTRWLQDLFQWRTGLTTPTQIWGSSEAFWKASVHVRVRAGAKHTDLVRVFASAAQVCPDIKAWDAGDVMPHIVAESKGYSYLPILIDSLRMTAEILRGE